MQSTTVITPKVEKYPNKPITIIVPFSAGGGLDLVARSLEKKATQILGQSIIIVNRPGGAGITGWNEVVNANPDGYTITVSGTEILLHPLGDSDKYDYVTALDPLVQVASAPLVMVVQTGKPWQTTDDLVQYAKSHPGQLKFGHGGIGSIPHVTGEIFAHAANITLEQVPFRGNSEAIAALLGGHIQIAFISPALAKEHIKNGTLKALSLTGNQRFNDPLFTQVPTFKEQGFDIVFSNWYGIAAPKELPIEIKTKLAESFKAIINEPEFKQSMENLGLHIDYLGPEESQTKWMAESQELNKAIHETGIWDQIKSQKQ
ncbi:tripartite tricarboxylate transporter substrate binding protein [Pelorhabdus rhamnosifermentans]|uniref:tripartite tricarboxylate transporter substrate binding protein n=1 Tax=Pelorhabdus rhamnosifermentans TaxID=2772457 RepID=UPI001C062494|nr:tripartite tricarboxylate transporter substrate binding protein [Pelorhabdus rhamnosifermentans]